MDHTLSLGWVSLNQVKWKNRLGCLNGYEIHSSMILPNLLSNDFQNSPNPKFDGNKVSVKTLSFRPELNPVRFPFPNRARPISFGPGPDRAQVVNNRKLADHLGSWWWRHPPNDRNWVRLQPRLNRSTWTRAWEKLKNFRLNRFQHNCCITCWFEFFLWDFTTIFISCL